MPKITYPLGVIGLLTAGLIASAVSDIVGLIRTGLGTDRAGLWPGFIIFLIDAVFLALAIWALYGAIRHARWVRWFLVVMTVLAVLVLFGNVSVAPWYLTTAYIVAILLFGSAAWLYRPAAKTNNDQPLEQK